MKKLPGKATFYAVISTIVRLEQLKDAITDSILHESHKNEFTQTDRLKYIKAYEEKYAELMRIGAQIFLLRATDVFKVTPKDGFGQNQTKALVRFLYREDQAAILNQSEELMKKAKTFADIIRVALPKVAEIAAEVI